LDDFDVASFDKIVSIDVRRQKVALWAYASGNATIGEETINDRVLCYFFDKAAFSLLDGIYIAAFAKIPAADETDEVWVIDPVGYISKFDVGTNFGVNALTDTTPALAGSPGTFSTTQLTLTQATLGNLPEGYKGFPITVVKASTGERATRICTADTLASQSVITVSPALPFTPANTSDFSVIVGSIETDFVSGEMSPAGPDKMTELTDVHLQLTPQATSASFTFMWKAQYGIAPAAVVYGERSISNQRNEYVVAVGGIAGGSTAGRRDTFRFQSLGPDQPFEIRQVTPRFTGDTPFGESRDDE
jgi:hypothetical protein